MFAIVINMIDNKSFNRLIKVVHHLRLNLVIITK
ncbi:hypothetical protein EC23916_1949, partial [Escherichia coli 2.3916]